MAILTFILIWLNLKSRLASVKPGKTKLWREENLVTIGTTEVIGSIRCTLVALGVATLFSACGDSGSGSVPTITGLAATGGVLANASVTAKCATGAPLSARTGADGTFSIDLVEGQTVPCLVQVSNGTVTIHGFAAQAGRINVTPLTDLVVSKALGADAASAFAGFDAGKGATINAGLAAAKTYVIAQVTPLAGMAPSGDPLTVPFKIGDADDKVLDNLAVALNAAGKRLDDLRAGAATGASLAAALGPEETRPQDGRTFTPADPAATTFTAMAAATGDVVDMSTTSRWAGVLNGAAYRIEVPANWNGNLVMYAHGYAGTGPTLGVSNPSIRRYLIQNGYAWAASSYSKNYYDVRAGIEDTNALALQFTKIAAANSRTLSAPSKTYITGHSMGGHITAAAIEDEAYATANNKVKYNGAVPMCGVVGDAELFNEFAAMQVTAQAVAGLGSSAFTSWSTVLAQVTGTLFSSFPSAAAPTAQIKTTTVGANYASALKNITGGERPLFSQGLAFGGSFPSAYGTFGGDGTVSGILTRNVLDTSAFVYAIDGDAAATTALNASAQKLTAVADANRLRRDGLRWIPKVNGEFKIPVVSIHTLGDLFVPFSMEQVYQKRAAAMGNSGWLVQRAIRGASHCDFTVAEQVDAFDAMIKWERDGIKPAGDDVVTPATVAASTFGCTHTKNTLGPDESGTTKALRPAIVATASCPAS